jgi:hypothetical protein
LNAVPDPDPATQINADPCGSGSGYGSGSETLPETCVKPLGLKYCIEDGRKVPGSLSILHMVLSFWLWNRKEVLKDIYLN